MKKRRPGEPDPQNPDPSLTYEYLILAGANTGRSDYLAKTVSRAPEYERDFARAALLTLYRHQKEQVDREGGNQIDPKIVKFVQRELKMCARDPDPLTSVENFLGLSGNRGRPRTRWRDSEIAGEVARAKGDGHTVQSACDAVAQVRGLTTEQVKRIYYAQKKADPDRLMLAVIRS